MSIVIGTGLLASASVNIAHASPTNTLAGNKAGNSLTTGSHNSAFGATALQANQKGDFNTAVGYGALRSTTGSDNVAVGNQALFENKAGGFNVAVGDGALKNVVSGSSNIGLGEDAGFNITNGDNNVCIANQGAAGQSGVIRIGTDGTHSTTLLAGNVGIGTGQPNTKLHVIGSDLFIGRAKSGRFAGAAGFDFNSNSSGNGFMIEQVSGESAGIYFDADSIKMWSAGDNNRLLSILDEDSMTEQFAIDGGGNAIANGVTLTSSRRFKENVAPIGNALEKVMKLQGVTFDWNKDRGGKSDIGFIAEDLGKILPELVLWEKNGTDAVGIEYANVTAVAVEALKELKAQKDQEISALTAANHVLEKRVEMLEARDRVRETRLTRLENALDKGQPIPVNALIERQ